MRKVILIILLMGCAFNGLATMCQNSGKDITDKDQGHVLVHVKLEPSVSTEGNMVLNLGDFVSCKSRYTPGGGGIVFISFKAKSNFWGELKNYPGYMMFYSQIKVFPLNSDTEKVAFNNSYYMPLLAKFFIEPDSSASGVVVGAGNFIGEIYVQLEDRGPTGGGPIKYENYIWKLVHMGGDIVIPTGTCDVSARNVTVSLPDYPASTSTPVPISVNCLKKQRLSYYLSGTTEDAGNAIFRNAASVSAAQGVGIQMTRNGKVIPANSNVSLGTVEKSSVDLGLTASYARTSGPLTAGNVQSIIGVTFVYQ